MVYALGDANKAINTAHRKPSQMMTHTRLIFREMFMRSLIIQSPTLLLFKGYIILVNFLGIPAKVAHRIPDAKSVEMWPRAMINTQF